MPLFTAKMTRRGFMFAGAMLLASACGNRVWDRRFEPENVLQELRNSAVIERVRNGKINFNHKDLEPMTINGKKAFKIVQRGLFALELVRAEPENFNFGVYGPQTTKAVRYLQQKGKLDPAVGRNGRCFEKNTLLILEAALQDKINNRWHPPGIL